MQRHGILNSHIAKVLADLGHTDTICISDCGLPVPEGVQKIDLALDFGVPSFEQVVSIIAKHMKSELVKHLRMRTLSCAPIVFSAIVRRIID